MAEGLLKNKLMKINPNYINDYDISSAGISVNPMDKMPTEEAILALKELGIDISNHIPHQLLRVDIETADFVICMTKSHVEYIKMLFNHTDVSKIRTLRELVGDNKNDILDPYGHNYDTYRKCAGIISETLDIILGEGIL